MSVNIDQLAKQVYKECLEERQQIIASTFTPADSTTLPGLDINVINEDYAKLISSDPADIAYTENSFIYKRIRAAVTAALSTLEAGLPNMNDPVELETYLENIATIFLNSANSEAPKFLANPDSYTDTQRFRDDGRIAIVMENRNQTFNMNDYKIKTSMVAQANSLLNAYISAANS